MDDSQPDFNNKLSPAFCGIHCVLVSYLALAALVFSPLVHAQSTTSSPATPTACPIQIIRFNPSDVTARIRNTSGKRIVGLVFNIALADAAEHWKWLHYDFVDTLPIREFGWNKEIKNGDAKTLSWSADVDFYHGGGGAFVLTSVLYEDGSSWEESKDCASCKYVWYNGHKKSLVRPVDLPYRQ